MAGALPHVWSHALGARRPTQKLAEPEPSTGFVQLTSTLPSPDAVRMGWSLRTPFPWKEPVTAATREGLLQVFPPSDEWDTRTSGLDSFPNPSVPRYATPLASNATEGSPVIL